MYNILIALIQSPTYYYANHNKENYYFEPWIRKPTIRWMQGLSTISLSYVCHPLFFNVRKELVMSDPRRIGKVIWLSIGFQMLIYVLIIIAGYLSLGSYMQVPVFILRPK